MTDERRYQEDEIQDIFETALTDRSVASGGPSPADGLTLVELQAIGREVGVSPERIADAASALELRRSAGIARTHLGMPISAGRIIDLPRAPTDAEWEMLVADLRETFQARGKEESGRSVRHWSNGNLHAFVEPTEDGVRLRMGTLKGEAAALNRGGIVALLFSIVFTTMLLLGGAPVGEFLAPLIFALGGAGALAYNAFRLPGWALEREQQMDYIAGRARSLLTPDTAAAEIAEESGGSTRE